MKRWTLLILGLLCAAAIGCLSRQRVVADSPAANAVSGMVVSRRTLTEHGGRVDWCPTGSEIAVYYATFGQSAPSQTIDILRLDQAY